MSDIANIMHKHVATRKRLAGWTAKLLRPLVKFLMRQGMSSQEFSEISRWVFVDVAMRDSEFALEGRGKQFKSRASVLTGLSRKEVLRLSTESGPAVDSDFSGGNRAARVLGGWCLNAQFRDGSGNPAVLEFNHGAGSFAELVRLYSGDVPPRAVLDELRRCGAVEVSKQGDVRLLNFSYYPENGDRDTLLEGMGVHMPRLFDEIESAVLSGTTELTIDLSKDHGESPFMTVSRAG